MVFNGLKFMLLDSFSPLMFYINCFHDHVMVVVIMILSMVLYVMFFFSFMSLFSRFFHSSEGLEIFWTIIPCMVLALLAIPSLLTLYMIEESINPVLTIKVIGHQWYWSYEYEDFCSVEFDSYMVPTEMMEVGEFRLLQVDKNLIIPCKNEIRLVITSSDVIHSWTIPSFGIKVDAIPGRLNQINLFSNNVGLYYGQCSEICGSFHSFMPICVESVPDDDFLKLVNSLDN